MSEVYILSGLLVGVLVGLTGVGGGSLMTPLLVLIFRVPATVAVGTDLAFAAVTKSVGSVVHRSKGQVRWKLVRLLLLGALPSTALTLLGLKLTGGPGELQTSLIKVAIALALVLTAVSLLFRDRIDRLKFMHSELSASWQRTITIASGALLGCLVTLSSIGAGAIGASLLAWIYPKMRSAEIAGTDLAYATPLAALAAIGHAQRGDIDYAMLGSLLIGSIPGILIGSFGASFASEVHLRRIMGTVLGAVAIKTLVSI